MSISILFYIILSILIPFLLFILPVLFGLLHYSWWVPQNFIISFIVSLIIGVVFVIFHTQNTNEQCQKINISKALVTGLIAMAITFGTINIIDYFPSIMAPFPAVFILNNDLAQVVYKSIIVYAVVFLNLTNVSFSSIKNTCKANTTQIKQVYKELEAKIK